MNKLLKSPKLRTRKRLQLNFPDDGLTQENFKEETDINNIMKRYATTGTLDHVNNIKGAYGDFSNVSEYQLHLDQVMAAQAAFDKLPAPMRARFNNDPAHLLRFLEDPKNVDEAVALGIATRPAPPQPKEPEARPKEPEATPSKPAA